MNKSDLVKQYIEEAVSYLLLVKDCETNPDIWDAMINLTNALEAITEIEEEHL